MRCISIPAPQCTLDRLSSAKSPAYVPTLPRGVLGWPVQLALLRNRPQSYPVSPERCGEHPVRGPSIIRQSTPNCTGRLSPLRTRRGSLLGAIFLLQVPSRDAFWIAMSRRCPMAQSFVLLRQSQRIAPILHSLPRQLPLERLWALERSNPS